MLNVNLNISPPWSSGIAYEIMMILGGSDKTMIVGGAVRDWLSGIPVKDIDFASKLLPDESMKILLKAGYNVKPIGIDHGTITVFNNNKSYEITSLRKDIITDGRHARVIFEGSWEDDAYRRDFTINALYSDEYGSIIDPTGLGFKDLESKTLRFIGKPQTRIKEDYIRIIRYFRFFSKYSKNIDKDSMESCIKYAKYLSIISGRRILAELEKIFLEKDSKNIINILVEKNIMNALYSPSLVKNFNLEKSLLKKIISVLNTNKNRNSYAFILYTSFIITLQNNKKYNSSKIVLSIVDRFSLSNNDKNLLNRNIAWISKNEIISKNFITKLWLDDGELFVLELKEILSIIDNKKVKMYLNTFNNAPPIFPISGKDLKKIGMSEGKKIGQIIKTTRDWWINNDCMPDKNKCISFIKKL